LRRQRSGWVRPAPSGGAGQALALNRIHSARMLKAPGAPQGPVWVASIKEALKHHRDINQLSKHFDVINRDNFL